MTCYTKCIIRKGFITKVIALVLILSHASASFPAEQVPQVPAALESLRKEFADTMKRYKKTYYAREKAICTDYDKELATLERRYTAGRSTEDAVAVQIERNRVKNGFYAGDWDKEVSGQISSLRGPCQQRIRGLQRTWDKSAKLLLEDYKRRLDAIERKLAEQGDTKGVQLVRAAFIEASYNANADCGIKKKQLQGRTFNFKTRKWNGPMLFAHNNRIEKYPHRKPKIWDVNKRGQLCLRFVQGEKENPELWGVNSDGEFYFAHLNDDPERVFTELKIEEGMYWSFYETEHNKPEGYVLGVLKEVRPEERRK